MHTDDFERRDSLHFPDVYLYPGHEGRLDPMFYGKEHGKQANILMAAEIKKAVNVPIIVVGKMDWKNGNRAIKKGYADIFLERIWPALDASVDRNINFAIQALPHMDNEFREKMIP